MLFGILWATLAPLILLVVVVVLAAFMRRLGWTTALAVATLVVVGPVAAIYFADRALFRDVCHEIGDPVIFSSASADGIYLDSDTANSFGNRYVQNEGFDWLERRDIYDRDAYVRVSRDAAGNLAERETPGISARYAVVETFEQRDPDIGISRVRVIDRQTGTEMARAGSATFSGGRMRWVLGVYGAASCPDAASEPGSFDRYYHLARNTLRRDGA